MYMPRRYIVVVLGFFGLLLSVGFRAVFSMVMVYVLREENTGSLLFFKECTINGTKWDLRLDWDVAVSQYFNTMFFLGYVATQLPGGYLAARISSKWVFGTAVLTSSGLLVVLSMTIRLGIPGVFVIRTLQGLAEGVCLPAFNGVISAWAPKSEKTRMVTLAYSGLYLSPAVALFASGATTCYISWHSSLFIYGGLGVVWSIVWVSFVHDTPEMDPNLSPEEKQIYEKEGHQVSASSVQKVKYIPWREMLTSLPLSAIFVGNFCRNWVFAMVVTELPQYYADGYKIDIASIGFLTSLPEILMTIVVVVGGIIFDQLIKSQTISTTTARKVAQCTGFGVESLCIFLLVFVNNHTLAMLLLCLGVGMSGLTISGYQVNPLDLAPQYAHVLTGISRLSCVGAVFSTFVAGYLRQDNLSSWQRIFLIASIIHFLGVVYYGIFASGERQPWADPSKLDTADSKLNLTSYPEYGTSAQSDKISNAAEIDS
ncbi:hypothetical protein FSP39_022499 [Pinctada imbricata]|uniref:Major facilitator superfamily (MFS) profile domain-containing protein n=1 Tax=Pinctada imbricata TaxID=66713 RepID=A0AA88Y5S4_PINIB|nr:hypothetical protein FSP39_022499 [Pinctada imbricata]